jgi:signal transduction histidine kinase
MRTLFDGARRPGHNSARPSGHDGAGRPGQDSVAPSGRDGAGWSYCRIMRVPAWRDLGRPQRVDLAIAAVLLAWGLPDVPWWWEPSGHAGSTPVVLGSLGLTLAMSVPFCWRRRFPALVLALAAGVLATRAALGRNEISAFAAVLTGAYGLGAYSAATRRYARWLGWAALAAALVTVAVNHIRLAAAPFALLGAAFVLGDAASARRAETAAAVAAAHQAERTRIARELHDVVAHQLSAIAVQAGAARIATGSLDAGGPGAGELGSTAEVLARVEQLSREALAELSHLLGALRRDPDAAADMPPAPTLAGLDALIASARQAGVPAELATEGQPRNLSPGAELSGYRIVSEALANVARHAPGATARVVLRYAAERLEITVKNTTPLHGHHRPPAASARPGAAPRPGAGPWAGLGLGVRGMRERAELYGGTLDAGPCPDGGFLVTATLPYGPAAGNQAGGAAGHQVSDAAHQQASDAADHRAGDGTSDQAGDGAGHQAGDEAAPTGGAR